MMVGAPGSVTGVAVTGELASPLLTSLTAETRKSYCKPFVRLGTGIEVAGEGVWPTDAHVPGALEGSYSIT